MLQQCTDLDDSKEDNRQIAARVRYKRDSQSQEQASDDNDSFPCVIFGPVGSYVAAKSEIHESCAGIRRFAGPIGSFALIGCCSNMGLHPPEALRKRQG